MAWFATVEELASGRDTLRRRRYGIIEVRDGQLARVRLRPFPRTVTWVEAWWRRQMRRAKSHGDCCKIFYSQPLFHSNYLSLNYVESNPGTSLASLRMTALVLDYIARLKRSDAILADVSNAKISDRLLRRWGWEPLRVGRWHRLFIKRFYGDYPAIPELDGGAVAPAKLQLADAVVADGRSRP